jgi:hypothetical protein
MAHEDPKGFAVEVDELDRIANAYLPHVAEVLRAPMAVITAHEGLEGPRAVPAVYAMEQRYAVLTNDIGYRQRVGCERIDATIEALREIATLYRRVDGQG